ncbi:MAG: peptidylprolyl isomerase [Methylococcales bacterium]
MDFTHLVHALTGGWLRSPALHCAALGGGLFAAVSLWGDPPLPPRLLIPVSRVETALQEYERINQRPLSPEEQRIITKTVVDQEVLYAYALRLGLNKEPVVERRLAQIATFVAENPHEAKSVEERANEAVLLGLGDGDLVVRRILIDGTKRLIRAAVLIREPADSQLAAYLRDHPEQFRKPGQVRLSQVLVDTRLHREHIDQDARGLLGQLRKDSAPPEAAGHYGDPGFVEPGLPNLTERELERRFGHRFVEQLAGLPAGSWEGPIPSRYGQHLVFIQERIPGWVPSLNVARREVRAKVREKLADEWLALRLEQLRGEFMIEVAGKVREGHDL